MSHTQIARHLRTTQIVVAIAQAQIFIRRVRVDRKRQDVRAIQNFQHVRQNLDVAGGQLWILRARQTRRHFAFDLDHILVSQAVRELRRFRIFFGTKHHLRQTFAIAQIDEDHAAVIAPDMHPAGDLHAATDVSRAQFIAMMCAIETHRTCVILSEAKNLSSGSDAFFIREILRRLRRSG